MPLRPFDHEGQAILDRTLRRTSAYQLEKSTSGMLLDAAPLVWFATLESIRDRKERYHALLNEEELARAERFRFPRTATATSSGMDFARNLGRSSRPISEGP